MLEKSKSVLGQSGEHAERIDYVEEFKRIFLDATDPKYRNISGKFLVLRMHHLERMIQMVKEMQAKIDEKQE